MELESNMCFCISSAVVKGLSFKTRTERFAKKHRFELFVLPYTAVKNLFLIFFFAGRDCCCRRECSEPRNTPNRTIIDNAMTFFATRSVRLQEEPVAKSLPPSLAQPITPEQKNEIGARDHFPCYYCACHLTMRRQHLLQR